MNQHFKNESAIVPIRAIHLDLKGLAPTPHRLMELLELFNLCRYNAILVEWEDMFPWKVEKRFSCSFAYSEKEINLFVEKTNELNIELIPLVQCLGHMENPLSVPGYEHLREIEDNESGLNPLAEGAGQLITDMIDDIFKLMPHIKHFHLGGDEARTFGQNNKTEAYIKEHGKGALYLQHVTPLLDHLIQKNCRPILWHDMMTDWDDNSLKALAEMSDLMFWGYDGHPDDCKGVHNSKNLDRFHKLDLNLWGASAYKGAESNWERHSSDTPVINERIENALAWVDCTKRYNIKGVAVTGWSRWAVDTVQCAPIDAALDSLVYQALILHDGEIPQNEEACCKKVLESANEYERFLSCKDIMKKLTDVRYRGWQLVQFTRSQIVLGKMDQRRTSARNKNLGFNVIEQLGQLIKEAQGIANEIKEKFKNLISNQDIEEYIQTRIKPLEDEYQSLKSTKF